MASIKGQNVKFNSSLNTVQALSSEDAGTIHFTSDGDIVQNGVNFTGVKTVVTGSTNGTVKVNGTDISVFGLDSAAYKAAGAASGNVPVNGAALSTTANTPVVTNASGQLVSHASGALGSAAFTDSTAYATADQGTAITTHIADTSNPHSVTKEQVGLGNVTNDAQVKRTEMGAANGVATLDADGKVPSTQLPSYVDDVIEAANKAALPTTGESSKIYVTLDDNKTYRWGGTTYVEISESLAIGTTTGTALDGKIGNDHITDNNIHVTAENKSEWSGKQDAIADLTTIRTNASNGATAYGWGNHAEAGYALNSDFAEWAKAATKPTYDGGEVKLSSAYAKADTGSTDFTAGETTVDDAIGKLAKAIDEKSSTTGTVTSVDLSMPTGLTVTGNPITTSGTLAVSYATGYSIPTTAKQSEWDDKLEANAAITGATKCKITYDSKGLVTAGADLIASDIPALDAEKITTGLFPDERIEGATKWNKLITTVEDNELVCAETFNAMRDSIGLNDNAGYDVPSTSKIITGATSIADAINKLDNAASSALIWD